MFTALISAFLFGLCFGSFANVCIYRLQKDQSVITPASRCPVCSTPIRWFHNIPVVSFIFLRARCADCGAPISWRYPLIELLTGICFAVLTWYFFPSPLLYFLFVFTFILIVISGIDYDTQMIPDILSYLLVIVGVAAAPMNYLLGTTIGERMIHAGTGALGGATLLLAIAFLGEKIFKKEAMGGGDIKMMLGLGAFVGLHGIFETLFIASLGGSIIGIGMMLTGAMKRGEYLPFGPFLAAGGFLTLFLPQSLSFFF